MGTPRNSRFVAIRDAMNLVNRRVNIAGVIIDVGFPRRTGGTDQCCTIRIIDESYEKPAMSVNIFEEKSEKLPHVAACGDVILLCSVNIETHGEQINAVFKKHFSSFALYNGKDNDNFAPYQVSSYFFSRNTDKMVIDVLRKWLVSLKVIEGSRKFPMLSEMKEGEYFVDLACKILHCCKTSNHEWMIFVWDGTDLPPKSISAKREDEMHDPLPLHVEPEPLQRELLCSFYTVGSILRITYNTNVVEGHLKFLDVGKWVKLINIFIGERAGQWHGAFFPTTKLRYTRDDDSLVQARERLYKERMSLNCRRLSTPSSVTVIDDEDLPLCTLMDVLTSSEVTAKFRCIVRVVASLPWLGECFRSKKNGRYRIRLTLEDPTARIHASVCAQDAETLFDGYPSNNILTRKMNILLGDLSTNGSAENNCDSRNPPWVQVCIKSFYMNKNNVWGSRMFRIFNTKIQGGD